MNISRLLARLIGPLFLAIGVGLFLNSVVYQTMAQEFLRSVPLIYLSGLLTLLAGLAIVNFHNLWVGDWRVVITVFGWLAVVGGAVRLILPQAVQAVGGTMLASNTAQMIGGAVVFALGAWLTYAGYFEKNSAPPKKRRGRK